MLESRSNSHNSQPEVWVNELEVQGYELVMRTAAAAGMEKKDGKEPRPVPPSLYTDLASFATMDTIMKSTCFVTTYSTENCGTIEFCKKERNGKRLDKLKAFR